MLVTLNAGLEGMNTFGLKVKAGVLVEYESPEELVSFLTEGRFAAVRKKPYLCIGGGSNLLFTGDFQGTLLCSRIGGVTFLPSGPDTVLARVGAGVVWDDFCALAASEGLWGPENLSLIPGTAGASAVQNIGAYGREAADIIEEVVCLELDTLRTVRFAPEECGYGYRESRFKGEWKGRYIVLEVVYRLSRKYSPYLDYAHVRDSMAKVYGPEPEEGYTPLQVRRCISDIRRSKLPDPSVKGNAGSFFKNPFVSEEKYLEIAAESPVPVPHFINPDGSVKIPAAWLIDRSGLKGFRLGGAAVCATQPLVLLNESGEASPAEIIALENHVTETVRKNFGITLHPEVEHI